MMHKLVLLDTAKTDIADIAYFYAQKVGPDSSRKIYKNIRGRISLLKEFPLAGEAHPDAELANMGYRKLVLNRTYIAIYKVFDDVVAVYRVVNGKTDYSRLLKN